MSRSALHTVQVARGVIDKQSGVLDALALQGALEELLGLRVLQCTALEVGVRVADRWRTGEIDVHGLTRVQIVGVVAETGELLVAALHPRGTQRDVIFVDGDIQAIAELDLVHPFGMTGIVHVRRRHDDVVEDEFVATQGR